MVSLDLHIGIIMDGNGRWAKKRMLPRTAGHAEGARVFRALAEHCADIGLREATFYAFSTENQKRPPDEVSGLLNLFRVQLDSLDRLPEKKNIRLRIIGDLEYFPADLRERFARVAANSAKNTGTIINIAANYGGRQEMVRAARQLAESGGEITAEGISAALSLPDVDVIIRTGGETRLSNFLLWQSAYAELFFTDKLFPDFSIADFDGFIEEFSHRQRRYGGV